MSPLLSSQDREVLRLALPAIGSGLTTMAYLWIDNFWAGRLMDARPALAALTIASFTRWIFSSVALLIGTGLTALVSRYVGAGKPQAASYSAYQGCWGAALLGIGTAAIGWFGAPLIYGNVSASEEVIVAGTLYVRIFWCAGFVILLQRAGDAIYRARGDATTPLLFSLLGLGLNALLDPILMFGWYGLPALGLGGASLATILSASIATTLSFLILKRRAWISKRAVSSDELKLHSTTRIGTGTTFGIDFVLLGRIIRVGVPVAWSGIVFSLIYLFVSRIVDENYGTSAVAALGLGHAGESVSFFICNGFAVAAGSLVGRQLGASRADRALHAAWRSTLFCSIGCGTWALVLVGAGHSLAAWMIPDDTTTQSITTSYYTITALCLIPQAVEITLEGAFGGAGKTVPPMVITVLLSVVRVPLAWWVADPLGLDVSAVWWVLCLTAIVRGTAMAWWFHRGTWRTARV